MGLGMLDRVLAGSKIATYGGILGYTGRSQACVSDGLIF